MNLWLSAAITSESRLSLTNLWIVASALFLGFRYTTRKRCAGADAVVTAGSNSANKASTTKLNRRILAAL
jgi:hypothetical protein